MAEMLNHRSRVRGNKDVKVYLGIFQLTQLVFFCQMSLEKRCMHKCGLGMGSVLEVIVVLQEPFLSSPFIFAHPNNIHPERPSGPTGEVCLG